MTEKIKNYLGLALIISGLLIALATWRYVSVYSRSIQPTSFRSFSVSGEGRVALVPDIAQFYFSVLTEGGTDIGQLQKDNTTKVSQAIKFLKDNQLDAKDIKTEQYNLSPRYETSSCLNHSDRSETCPPPQIVGYSINQTVSVKIRQPQFDLIGQLLAGVVKQGANTVSQLSFTIDDPTTAENNARAEAIIKAKEKAKVIARAGGFSLGQLLGIEEGGVVPVSNNYTVSRSEMTAPAPSIEPGSQEVRVTLTLRYEIN